MLSYICSNPSIFYYYTVISTMSHICLNKLYAIMWDIQQFICRYCNFTALKLEANNVNKY